MRALSHHLPTASTISYSRRSGHGAPFSESGSGRGKPSGAIAWRRSGLSSPRRQAASADNPLLRPTPERPSRFPPYAARVAKQGTMRSPNAVSVIGLGQAKRDIEQCPAFGESGSGMENPAAQYRRVRRGYPLRSKRRPSPCALNPESASSTVKEKLKKRRQACSQARRLPNSPDER